MKRFTIFLTAIVMLFAAAPAPAEQAGTFAGSWIASGKKQSLEFGAGREVFTFNLAGHVSLKTGIGQNKDYWSDCVGLWDSRAGSSARCVWRDLEGQRAYVVISGPVIKEGALETGEFVGGTGKLKGLTGGFTFSWSSLFRDRDEGILTGQTEDIQGTYRIP